MKKSTLLFPGQGSQYTGMGKKQYQQSRIVSTLFEEASDFLGYNLQILCFDGSEIELADTEITQPAVFVTSVALYEYFKETLPIPQFMAGHSVGEYAALVCSGALSFSDGLAIVQKRGELMKAATERGEGTMAAITGIDAKTVEQVCASIATNGYMVSVAAYNSTDQLVISGNKQAVHDAGVSFTKLGASVTPLKVSAPFHCSLMSDAAYQLKPTLLKATYNAPNCKILSNVTGLPYTNSDDIIENLTMQMTHPVKWMQSMNYLVNNNVYFCIEIGPGKTLKNLLRKENAVKAFSVDVESDVDQLQSLIAANTNSLITIITKCLGISMSIKNNNYDSEEYQKGVVEPFRRIKSIQWKLESQQSQPNADDIAEAVSLFCQILNTKITDQQEKLSWLEQLFSETGTLNLMPLYASHLK